jgi:hypothetical protein
VARNARSRQGAEISNRPTTVDSNANAPG